MYEFSKVAGYKISIQKSVAFPYTNHEISQRELKKKKNSFKVCKKKKDPRNKLNQGDEDLYAKNYKRLI